MLKVPIGQKLVQELAESGAEPPLRFVQKKENCPIGPFPPASGVPLIDLGRLFKPDFDDALRLKSGLMAWGLFQVVSEDMPPSFLDEVQCMARKFFELPKEDKLKYSNQADDGEFKLQGYGNDMIATEDQVLDWNDRLYLLVQPENERIPELWPDNPNSFRTVLHEYSIKARKIADNLFVALAKLLELEENYFTNQFGEDASVGARFTYYPACNKRDSVIGLKPHSDCSALTLVLPDKDVEGYQVFKDGEWFAIPTVPNALLVNLGDEMEIMSNGVFKSPVHRVVINSQKRVSIAMFYYVNGEKYIEPASNLVNEARPKVYKKVLFKDYLKLALEAFAQGKRAIDLAKI